MDGWSDEVVNRLEPTFSELEQMMYEVRFCTKGAFTHCVDTTELADYLRGLADDLGVAADDIEFLEEDEDDESDSYEE